MSDPRQAAEICMLAKDDIFLQKYQKFDRLAYSGAFYS
jgi:hypothetical protein